MFSQFSVSIPESHWSRITDEHKDGRLVWIRGEIGNVDLARWYNGKWNCELGSVDDPTDVAGVSIDAGIDTTKSLLHYFAGQALANSAIAHSNLDVVETAKVCVKQAIAVIEELERIDASIP